MPLSEPVTTVVAVATTLEQMLTSPELSPSLSLSPAFFLFHSSFFSFLSFAFRCSLSRFVSFVRIMRSVSHPFDF
jgi:hypothetical protein